MLKEVVSPPLAHLSVALLLRIHCHDAVHSSQGSRKVVQMRFAGRII
jgi:hypothetical protein